MRARSTWQQSNGSPSQRQAATQRQADIYTMNQEHPQPSVTEYENGDPNSWAETPVPGDKMSVNAEYDGEHVKRNEVGLGEFRDDTWKHKDSDKWGGPGKYDNARVSAERKASNVERIARVLLPSGSDEVIEQVACSLMAIPDHTIEATINRMDAHSIASLPIDSKHRRALACTKLAARTLGASANEQNVEALAREFMSLNDRSLKSMLSIVSSSVRVAEEQQALEQECSDEACKEEAPKVSQEQEQQEQVAQEQQEQQVAQEQEEQQEQVAHDQPESGGLSPEEMSELNGILQNEVAPADDSLSSLFVPGQTAPAAPVPNQEAPAAPPGMPNVSFDEDEDEAAINASLASVGSLDSLFVNDEVMAQRELVAASREQQARAAGYQSVGRTASTKGVKKLGQVVRPTPVDPAQALESIWDRP